MDDESEGTGGTGLGKKIGPLPMGAWALILGGVGGLLWFWRRSTSASSTTAAADSAAAGSGDDTPTTVVPVNQGLSEQQYKDLQKSIKDMNGAPSTPAPPTATTPSPPTEVKATPIFSPKPVVKPAPTPITKNPVLKKKPPWTQNPVAKKPVAKKPVAKKPVAKKPVTKGPGTVTVVKWTKDHTPWNSTLWGIAHHEHVKGGWQYLQKLNHITGDPKKALKPGMKIKL